MMQQLVEQVDEWLRSEERLAPTNGQVSESSDVIRSSLPLAFVENQGQVDTRAKFYLRTGSQTLWLTSDGITFDLLRVKPGTDLASTSLHPKRPDIQLAGERERLVFVQDLLGCNKNLVIQAKFPQPGTHNYFLGNDPSMWHTGVKAYAEVIYREVWKGIDLRLYAHE